MIRTTLSYSDPNNGIEAPAEVVAGMQAASKILEEAVQDTDPLQFNAVWQYQHNDRQGTQVVVRIRCNDEEACLTFGTDEIEDRERLEARLGRNLFDLASKLSKANLRSLLKMQEEWKRTPVEG